jgi:transcriptional regulator with XRE-family HTH domain
MENTSRLDSLSDRTIFYYRQRCKNRLFEAITAFFAEEAERRGITKRDIAECLRRDPAQITRWLTNPSNLTADTISDLLLSLGAEMDYRIVRFEDRPQPNERHSLMSAVTVPRVSKKQISTSAKFEELTTAQTSAPPTPSIEFHQL